MAPSIADRLQVARRRFFVGRKTERQLWQIVLEADEPPFNVLNIYGPGGVGKTMLLHEYAAMAQESGLQAVYADMRNVEPTPDSFEVAITLALGGLPPADPHDLLRNSGSRTALLLDTCEGLAPLESWLRTVFLPQLPANVLVVMAGRHSVSNNWRTDPGWHGLLRVMPLRNLTPEESLAYLNLRTVPEAEQTGIVEFTHGHPLAISLVADVLDQDPNRPFEPLAAPDIIRALLERLVQDAPSRLHQTALEASSLALYITEALLAAMLKVEDARPYFDWLRDLSFMEAGRYGLFPHDLVREALSTDLRWRDPDWYAELHRLARNFYHDHLVRTSGFNQRRILAELVFLHRDNEVVRSFLEFQVNDNLFTDRMRSDDVPALTAMVRRYEGDAAAQLFMHWQKRQPDATIVIRDQHQAPVGFVMFLTLNDATPEAIDKDPATRAAWQYVQGQSALRPGEKVAYIRFWMDKDEYQGLSTTQSRIFLNCLQYYLTTPGLAMSFFACQNPDYYNALLMYADIHRLAQADFTLDGRTFGVFFHDWRAVPPAAWLDLMGEREIAYSAERALPPPAPAPTQPVVVLSEPDFAQAVREALKHYTRSDALQGNPLVHSRLVVEKTGADASPAARAKVLHALISDAVDLLQTSPRQLKFYRALYHTYVQPAATQELAAELLDLPFSTYRRHLREGIDNVVTTLWQRETGMIG